ncbi:hypothetical protein M5K25_020296 [Dendrobium thyrsiflorum]|uniref:non-specific serine/threonine protein kinase n=1 Tax=Dendrobium thyrsiflorum TaxID=117978 RepID=A0ABD0UGJ6_DENTH
MSRGLKDLLMDDLSPKAPNKHYNSGSGGLTPTKRRDSDRDVRATATATCARRRPRPRAVNTILHRWRQTELWLQKNNGELCSDIAVVYDFGDISPAIDCDCTFHNGTVCHVIRFLVFALNLTGAFPQELSNLNYLRDLDVSANFLIGPLPAFIGNLSSLMSLRVGRNFLTGTLPTSIENLSSLKWLDVGGNFLTGPLPAFIGNLSSLRSLTLGPNNFSGTLPVELGGLRKLQQWDMTSCGLSGELPTFLSNLTAIQILIIADNNFIGKIPDFIGTLSNLEDLDFGTNALSGPIPRELGNLKNLISLRLGPNNFSGNLPAELGGLGELQNWDMTSSGLSGELPTSLSNLTTMQMLILRNAKICDTLPSDFAKFGSLETLDLSFNNITGNIPQSLLSLRSLKILFLGNNSITGTLPGAKSSTLNYQFAINCGGDASVMSSDGTNFDIDSANLSAASYFVTNEKQWAISNAGSFIDASNPNANYIISSQIQSKNTLDSKLFKTARMSPSSLRYYGLGLENGNYKVKLQFSEIGIPDQLTWTSLARRVFDIYIQGMLKEKDFDIRKEAGGKSFTVVLKEYQAPVTNNFLEIHLFWAGKGTTFIPSPGYYGPSISAISVSPYDFIPSVRKEPPHSSSSNNNTALVVGIVCSVVVLGLTVFAILVWKHKQIKCNKDNEEFLGMTAIPNTFSYSELRTATEDFNQSNFLGEGGFGPVFKGKLHDGRMVAVKQLSLASQQGERQFTAEIATISAVQHRNLANLYGCCIEGDKRILVYEYLENKSLDQAIFGKKDLHLDWKTRFEICLGVARGLAYLHEESSVRIIHRDVKSSNILLDGNLTPKISDFGLAKLYDDKWSHISTRVAGTIGYLAPEYAMRGHLTEKVDVFSFGVVALEVLSGRRNSDPSLEEEQSYLLDWAWHLYEQKHELDLVDPSLSSYNRDEAIRVIEMASSKFLISLRHLISSCCCFFFLLCFFFLFSERCRCQASAVSKIDPIEARAVNTILHRWKQTELWLRENNGELCSNNTVDYEIADFTPVIECDCTFHNGTLCHVTRFEVSALNLTGAFPQELSNLTYLTDLEVNMNFLTGPLPAFIGNLTSLQSLNVGWNFFTGPLPTFIENLSSLRSLNVAGNFFAGPLPDFIGNLSSLQLLNVGGNFFSGPFPAFIGNLSSLQSITFGPNNFSGTLPAELGSLRNLQEWDMTSSGISGELPTFLSNLTAMQTLIIADNNFIGKIPDFIGTLSNLKVLNLTQNYLTGSLPTFIGNFSSLTFLDFGTNALSGPIPRELGNLKNLISLRMGPNNFSGNLPAELGGLGKLQNWDMTSSGLSGELPTSLSNLTTMQMLFLGNNSITGTLPRAKSSTLSNMNLVANNFVIDNSNSRALPSGLECLQRDMPCYRDLPAYYQFAINCGGDATVMSSDGTNFDIDNANLSAASYFVTNEKQWAISNAGSFIEASNPNANYIISSQIQSQNTLDSKLFKTARMSPSSLRYYGLGLENGNYKVKLQFSEIGIPDQPTWTSLARRVFDIYIQGMLKEKDFDIRKEAGGKSFIVVLKEYQAPVTNNFLEIHLFWAGKGTTFIPSPGYYGPSISAISVSPYDFIPSVRNKPPHSSSSNNNKALVVGIVCSVVVLGLTVFAILVWKHKQTKCHKDNEELLGMTAIPNTFSYSDLRTATEDFNRSNFLGEGGFGSVFKGKLLDGRMVAVKQLSLASRQGERQFMTEIATISAVQHRNLAKLYGCCIEGDKKLLVYEYLENKSLDQAIFGKKDLHLDWKTRFEICLGVARGLAYLHEESRVRIIHRDVKSSNILLDGNLTPKISDFGLAKLYNDKWSHISTRVAGTIGYLAPEYAMRGHLTEKVDVFSFGVVALEVLSGRRNSDPSLEEEQSYLLDWAWHLYEQKHELDLVDPSISSYNRDEAIRVIGVSLLCIQTSPTLRPAMSTVVAMLAGFIEVNEVTSRPSYLTECHFKDISNNFASDGFCKSTDLRETNSQVGVASNADTVNLED